MKPIGKKESLSSIVSHHDFSSISYDQVVYHDHKVVHFRDADGLLVLSLSFTNENEKSAIAAVRKWVAGGDLDISDITRMSVVTRIRDFELGRARMSLIIGCRMEPEWSLLVSDGIWDERVDYFRNYKEAEKCWKKAVRNLYEINRTLHRS